VNSGYSVERTFIQTVRTRNILPEKSKVIAAVSGGGDSIALLELLIRFRNHMKWDLAVVHIDHGARPESSSEARFVEKLAAEEGIPFILRSIEPIKTGSLEDYFSRKRQSIFESLQEQGSLVATGHNADDRAETILMRLLEGSGLRGLGGMDYIGVGPVRRPLLDLERSSLREYLKSIGRNWLEDPSNKDRSILRNRIRHEVMPVLQSISPGFRIALGRSSANLSSWRDVVDGLVSESLDRVMQGNTFLRMEYASMARAMRLALLWSVAGKPRGGRLELEKTDRWILSGQSGSHAMPGGRVIRLEGDSGTIVDDPSTDEGG
jgi:tRNA(Ile)-lysidine synthase